MFRDSVRILTSKQPFKSNLTLISHHTKVKDTIPISTSRQSASAYPAVGKHCIGEITRKNYSMERGKSL